MKTNETKHIMVVDDNEEILSLLSRALGQEGFLVTAMNDSTIALKQLINGCNGSAPVDFLITDFNMPKCTGLELMDGLQSKGVKLPSVLISGNPDETIASEAKSKGCVGFLQKPFILAELSKFIHHHLGGKVKKEPIQA